MDDDFKARREELRKVADAIDVENGKYSPDGDKVLNGLYNLRKEELELRITKKKIESFQGVNDKDRNVLETIKEDDLAHVRASKILRNVKKLRNHHSTQKSQIEEQLERRAEKTDCIHIKVPTPDFGFLIKLSRQLAEKHGIDVCLISEDRMLKEKTPAVMSPENGLAMDELNSISRDEPEGDKNFAKTLEVKPTAQTQYQGLEKDANALFYLFLKHQLYKS